MSPWLSGNYVGMKTPPRTLKLDYPEAVRALNLRLGVRKPGFLLGYHIEFRCSRPFLCRKTHRRQKGLLVGVESSDAFSQGYLSGFFFDFRQEHN